MIVYTFILGADIEDISNYLQANKVEGVPIFIIDMYDLRALDLSNDEYIIVKTELYWKRPDIDRCEEALLRIKASNYKGPVYFIDILGIITPCMSYKIQIASSKIEWPNEVPTSHNIRAVVTTVYGRTYDIYCCELIAKSFCGDHMALALLEPLVYTGGFA